MEKQYNFWKNKSFNFWGRHFMKRILVIDDDTFMCDLLVNHLTQSGFEVQGTYSGKNGVKLVENNHFDVILCDYRLPNTDGYEVLKQIKAKKPLLPVIIMTAYAEIRMAVKLIKSGAYDYVTKPVQPEEIKILINKALESKEGKETETDFQNNFVTGSSKEIKR